MWATYYQENKERLQKKACERYQNLSEEEKEKSNDIFGNVKKISQKMKIQTAFEYRKKY